MSNIETFKNIILPPQYNKVIKTVLTNSYNNLGNTKIHDNCKPKNKDNYTIVYTELSQVWKMHSKKQRLSFPQGCCLLVGSE